ncbi:MAG: YdeI/OmpD-associated family protein [Flectobacillus sp.]|uniref:YdeI/OmpD-associated family protein n=1 Tax=Flectobacillus sp. TaxID=50419 RepID=UPI003B9A90D5
MTTFPTIHFQSEVGRNHPLKVYYLSVPPDVVQALGGKMGIRFLCSIKHITWQAGLVALGEGWAYINLSTKRMKEAGLSLGSIVEVKLEPDQTEYGATIPEELQAVFDTDPEGYARFQGLTKGMQRYIIHYADGVKSTQLRIERALMMIENLKKLPVGKEEFRRILGKND